MHLIRLVERPSFQQKVTYVNVAGHERERYHFSTVLSENLRMSSSYLDCQDNLMIEHADKLEKWRLFD